MLFTVALQPCIYKQYSRSMVQNQRRVYDLIFKDSKGIMLPNNMIYLFKVPFSSYSEPLLKRTCCLESSRTILSTSAQISLINMHTLKDGTSFPAWLTLWLNGHSGGTGISQTKTLTCMDRSFISISRMVIQTSRVMIYILNKQQRN